MFKTRYRSFIQSQLLTIDEFYNDMKIDEEAEVVKISLNQKEDDIDISNNINESENVIKE